MLQRVGFERVTSAENGAAAIAQVEDGDFHIVISDWNMEPVDGVELLRSVRQNPLTADTPFVLMTASLSETAWRGAIEHGATDFLLKPITFGALRATCELCLQIGGFAASVPLRERLRQRRFAV
jgi:two-component system chemotaxis response regulator CheY